MTREARWVGATLRAKNATDERRDDEKQGAGALTALYVSLGLGHGPTVGRSPNRSVTASQRLANDT